MQAVPFGAALRYEGRVMKLEDVILVTENRKGVETNYLSAVTDYLKLLAEIYRDNVTDLSEAIDGLYRTRQGRTFSEVYAAPNHSYYAKFCGGEGELKGFVSGALDEGKAVFAEKMCSTECFEILKTYGIGRDGHSFLNSLHYEAKEYSFKQGEILHNLNGCDYRVLSVLSEKNLLLMAQTDGQYILAINTVMYERFPKEEPLTEDNVIRGVEWGHGSYLGHDIMQIDLPGIMQEYGAVRELETVDDYRDEARRQFYAYQWIFKDKRLTFEIRWAAEKSMTGEFGTTDCREFETLLQKGRYDRRMKLSEEKRNEEQKEKSR